MAKIIIGKSTGDGEMVNVELDLTRDHFLALKQGVSLHTQFQPFYQMLDDRMFEMNQRILASSYLVKKLPKEARTAFNDVVDVFHGKAGAAREDALEAARLEYEENKRKIEAHDKAVADEEAQIKAEYEAKNGQS